MNTMKKWMGMMMLVMIACAGVGAGDSAAAGRTEATIDASLLYATEPRGGYDSTVGIGVGALIDLSNSMSMSQKDMKLGVRGDLAYFDWDGNFYGIGVSYTRLAFFGGPRLTFGKLGGGTPVVPYVEGGLELTFDEVEVVVPGLGKHSASETSLGLAGGGGIDFILASNLKLGVNGRLHLIDDDFLTLGVTLGMMF
jgi:hypothetical protein